MITALIKYLHSTFLLLLIIGKVGYSQTIINSKSHSGGYYLSDSTIKFNTRINKKKEGWWESSYFPGKTHKIQEYKNGVKEGEIIKFYFNGRLKMEGHYENGEKNGCFIFYKNTSNFDGGYTRYYYEKGKKKFKYPPEGHQAL